eukprot:1156120-Pelagomonas_calceolata.AAC.6
MLYCAATAQHSAGSCEQMLTWAVFLVKAGPQCLAASTGSDRKKAERQAHAEKCSVLLFTCPHLYMPTSKQTNEMITFVMASWTIFQNGAILSALLVEARKVTVRVTPTVDTSELSSSFQHLLLQLSCPCRQKQTNVTYRVIFKLMDILCVAGAVEQAEQPNYLAEGQLPLYRSELQDAGLLATIALSFNTNECHKTRVPEDLSSQALNIVMKYALRSVSTSCTYEHAAANLACSTSEDIIPAQPPRAPIAQNTIQIHSEVLHERLKCILLRHATPLHPNPKTTGAWSLLEPFTTILPAKQGKLHCHEHGGV